MLPLINDLHLTLVLALAPFAGVLAIRELWSRRRSHTTLRAREERAEHVWREAVRAMHEARAAADGANRSREEFLARMSHELRTPLNAVIGFSRVLENNRAGNQRPEDLRLLSRVRLSGEKLLRLVEEVLDQSRIERGELALASDATDVVGIAAQVVMNYRSTAAAKGLRLLAVLPESAPSIQLDAARFAQVLEHLVDNAVKFTTSGSVRVTLVTANGLPSRLIVSDSGIGIPADRLEQIFQPFAQVDSSARRAYDGAGLGLPLARQLCQRMGCELTVESEVGKGSRFSVRFPIGAPEP
jgi:signal transduction histidine kinase